MHLKKYLKYSFYILPGYGVYKEFKKPKEQRRIHRKIGWISYSSGALLKLALLPSYILIGNETGNWSPFNTAEYLFNKTKNKIENQSEKKESKLEKTFYIKSSTMNSKNNSKESSKLEK